MKFVVILFICSFMLYATEDASSNQKKVNDYCQQFKSNNFILNKKDSYNTLAEYIKTMCHDCGICKECIGCNDLVNDLIWKSVLIHPQWFVDIVDSLNKEEFHEVLNHLSRTTEDVSNIKKAIDNLEALEFNSNLKMWLTRSMRATLKRKTEE